MRHVDMFASCYAVVPEDDAERRELFGFLDDCGVRDSMTLNEVGVKGRVNFGENPQWDSNGALKVSIAIASYEIPKDAWFWVVEFGDGRRFAYWSFQPDGNTAQLWNQG